MVYAVAVVDFAPASCVNAEFAAAAATVAAVVVVLVLIILPLLSYLKIVLHRGLPSLTNPLTHNLLLRLRLLLYYYYCILICFAFLHRKAGLGSECFSWSPNVLLRAGLPADSAGVQNETAAT